MHRSHQSPCRLESQSGACASFRLGTAERCESLTGQGVDAGVVRLLGPHHGAHVRQAVRVDALRLGVLRRRGHAALRSHRQTALHTRLDLRCRRGA